MIQMQDPALEDPFAKLVAAFQAGSSDARGTQMEEGLQVAHPDLANTRVIVRPPIRLSVAGMAVGGSGLHAPKGGSGSYPVANQAVAGACGSNAPKGGSGLYPVAHQVASALPNGCLQISSPSPSGSPRQLLRWAPPDPGVSLGRRMRLSQPSWTAPFVSPTPPSFQPAAQRMAFAGGSGSYSPGGGSGSVVVSKVFAGGSGSYSPGGGSGSVVVSKVFAGGSGSYALGGGSGSAVASKPSWAAPTVLPPPLSISHQPMTRRLPSWAAPAVSPPPPSILYRPVTHHTVTTGGSGSCSPGVGSRSPITFQGVAGGSGCYVPGMGSRSPTTPQAFARTGSYVPPLPCQGFASTGSHVPPAMPVQGFASTGSHVPPAMPVQGFVSSGSYVPPPPPCQAFACMGSQVPQVMPLQALPIAGSHVPPQPIPQVPALPLPQQPLAVADQSLLRRLPNPALIGSQKVAFSRDLDAKLKDATERLEKENAERKRKAQETAAQQKAALNLQVDQQLKLQEISLDKEMSLALMSLKTKVLDQRAALEHQAAALTLEYQNLKMREEFMAAQAEMQRQYNDSQLHVRKEASKATPDSFDAALRAHSVDSQVSQVTRDSSTGSRGSRPFSPERPPPAPSRSVGRPFNSTSFVPQALPPLLPSFCSMGVGAYDLHAPPVLAYGSAMPRAQTQCGMAPSFASVAYRG